MTCNFCLDDAILTVRNQHGLRANLCNECSDAYTRSLTPVVVPKRPFAFKPRKTPQANPATAKQQSIDAALHLGLLSAAKRESRRIILAPRWSKH